MRSQPIVGSAPETTGTGGSSSGPFGSADIIDGSLTGADIASASVPLGDLATIADGTLLGNNTGGVSVPVALTAAQAKTLLAIVSGDVSGLGSLATLSSVDSAHITDGTIVDGDINAAAAIALSKLATDPLARANHTGTQTMSTISDAGALATLNAVGSAQITDGTIVNGDISGTAAIALSKLATDPLARANHTGTQTMSTISDAGALATLSAVGSAQITDGTIVDGDINASAAVALTKLAAIADQRLVGNVSGGSASASALTAAQVKTLLAIASGDVSGLGSLATLSTVDSAHITDGTIVNGDVNAAAGIALSKLATDPLARANHTGTQTMSTISDAGTLATLNAVASAQITDGTIVDGDINASAAVALTKMASIADQRLLGNVSGSSAAASALTATQAKTLLAIGISDVTSLQTNLDTINGVVDATRPLASGDSTILRGNWSNAISTGTGNLRLAFFTARRSFTSTQVRLISGATAASATPTLVRAALYTVDVNGDGTRVATIASDTSIFAAANTEYLRSWQASIGLTAGSKYALGILVVTAGTAPTLPGETGQAPGDAAFARLPRMSGSLGSQSDVPTSFTHAGLANFSGRFYAEIVL